MELVVLQLIAARSVTRMMVRLVLLFELLSL